MERVMGIGGIFLRARNPQALSSWYETILGINPAPTDIETKPWRTTEGPVVFAPFPDDSEYFPARQQVMINFRVADMAAMLAQLRAAKIPVFNESEMEGVGRFAHLNDPEGNAIELWEPA